MIEKIMSNQLPLFNKTETRFEKFNAKHPEIYRMFRTLALEAIGKGYKKFSSEIIVNVIRWKTMLAARESVRISGGEVKEIKINNDFKPFMSRRFMKEFPQHEGFFETRKSKADLEVI